MKKKVLFFSLMTAVVLGMAVTSVSGFKHSEGVSGLENEHANPLLLDETEYASHYLARYYNQDGFEVATSETVNMVVPGYFDNTSKVEWKASYARYSASKKHIRLGYYGSANECIATNGMVTNSTDADFAEIASDLGEQIGTYNAGLVSAKYFTNIQDISIYWSGLTESISGNRIRIVYKTDDSDQWKILLRDDGEGGVGYDNYSINIDGGTGVEGDWNAFAAHAGNYTGNTAPSETGDFTMNLKGKNAKIGFIYTVNWPSYSWYWDVTAICINRVEAIKGYVNFLDRFTWTCNAIQESGNLYNLVFDVMGYKFLQHHADALDVASEFVNGRETTYFNQFKYLYDIAVGASLPYSPSSAINVFLSDNKFELIVASICLLTLTSVGALFITKKRKMRNN